MERHNGIELDPEGAFVYYDDAQATVEALQAIIKQMGEQACVLAKDGMAAKAQVEALQRERDHAKNMAAVQKEVADNQTWHVRELTAALDAEREKVKGLHEITKIICGHCCEPMAIPSRAVLQAALTPAGGGRNDGITEESTVL